MISLSATLSSLWVILLCLSFKANAKIHMLMNERFEDCTEGGAKYGDFSGLEYVFVNDTTYYLNGRFRSLRRVASPWKSYYFIEKFDRNQWNRALIDKHIPDFCKVFQSSREPWFFFTSNFKQGCPFDEGYEENFDMIHSRNIRMELASFGLLGKYRVTFYSYFPESTDCMKVGFELAEL